MVRIGFTKIVVVGVGLIGGSLAAALKQLDDAPAVLGIDTDPDTLSFAIERGYIDEGVLPGDPTVDRWIGPEGADLVVLATPVERTVEWLRRIGESGYLGVVTDTGSTKTPVVDAAARHLPHVEYFVPGHPMAGSESSGVTAARPDLFSGAYWILTPGVDTDMHVFRRVHTLLTAVGARVVSVDPDEHDSAVAIVSHVPHVAASSLVALAARHAGPNGELLRLAAGGFKDTTRVAAGSPELWTGICLDNADAIARGLHEFGEVIARFEDLVSRRDAQGLSLMLSEAADVRNALPAKWIPQSAHLTSVRVPIGDRPGVVAEITGAAGRTGCNIQAIDIDHQTEDRAILQLILTDEGDLEAFERTLAEAGFTPRFSAVDGGSR